MKRIRKLTTAFLVIALLVTSLVSVPAFAAEDPVIPDIVRIAGDNRYLTAIEVSKEVYAKGDTSDNVIIASGEEDHWADALAGSALAGKLEAPILLAKKDMIHAETLAEIARLKAKTVYILGGEEAIGPAVATTLLSKVTSVKRIAGANRYETAALIAAEIITGATGYFLATGEDYADALAIGPVAYAGTPVLLTKKDSLPEATAKALKDASSVTILGGTAAVSKAVEREVNALIGGEADRVYGANRFETALAIAEYFTETFEETFYEIVIAQGKNFPDALVGGYFAGKKNVPILLVGKDVEDEVAAFITAGEFKTAYILGGPQAVSEAVEAEVETALLGFGLDVNEIGPFYVGAAEGDATVNVTVENTGYNGKKEIALTLKGVALVEDTDYEVDEYKITLFKAYLNKLAVGEYAIAVTVDGHAAGDIEITVLDDTVATLTAEVTPPANAKVKLSETKDGTATVAITVTGFDPDASPVTAVDLEDVVVKVNGVALKGPAYTAPEFNVDDNNDVITIQGAFLKAKGVGTYTVDIELKDGRKASTAFEIYDADAIDSIVASFNATAKEDALDFDFLELELDEVKAASTKIYVVVKTVGDDGTATLDAAKFAVCVDDKALTATTDFAFNDKKITFTEGYLETLEAGTHTIVVKYDGAVIGTLTLELWDKDAIVSIAATFTTDDGKTEATWTVGDEGFPTITVVAKNLKGGDAPIVGTKLAVSVDDKALTVGDDFNVSGKTITLEAKYVATLKAGAHTIVVKYDGAVIGTLELTVKAGPIAVSEVSGEELSTIKGVTADIEIDDIYKVTITLMDANKNLLAGKKIKVVLDRTGATVKLAASAGMAGAKEIGPDGLEYTADANGKVTFYLQATELGGGALKLVVDTKLELTLFDPE